MTIILTYDDVFSRVRISVTGLNVATDAVLLERSTNQISWSTVRGGAALLPVANSVSLDDYEFSANVVNYYRATAVDTASSTYVTGGPAVTGNNTSLVATMPLGLQSQDLVLILASIRNSGAGTPNAPSGWSTIVDASNVRMFGKIVTGAEPAPTVTFSGGVANADTLAQTAAFRGVSTAFGNTAQQLNASAQDVARPGMVVPANNMTVLTWIWKQDDWTSVNLDWASPIQGNGAISTAGNDAAQAWGHSIQGVAANVPATPAVVTGGAAAISRGGSVALYHRDRTLSVETASITPTISGVWLKDLTKPFLNRMLNCIPNQTPITRRARNGIFPIVGRTFPVAVSDVRLARELTIEVITQTMTQWQELDLITLTGDVFFIQTPPGNSLPTMYVVIGDINLLRPLRNLPKCGNDWRVFTLPLTEVAPPASDLVGSIGTWQTVVNTYATWSDVIAAHSTWASLMTLVGSPGEVVVP